jgi:hypothetical protein
MKHHFFTRRVAILSGVVTVLLIVFLTTLFVRKMERLDQPGRIFTKHRRHPITEADVVRISEWMTFDYINTVFGLPTDYLKDTLRIEDTKYPSLTLGKYARKTNIDITTFVTEVRKSVDEVTSKQSGQ